MKKFITGAVLLLFTLAVNAQDPAPAKPGVVYGKLTEKEAVVSVNNIEGVLDKNRYTGKVEGKVVEVCQAMGCWAKLEREDGSTVMIKVKDHEFAMPKDIVGKTVIAEGEASFNETSVKMLKHYAEDAGKSKEEVDAIKEPKKEITMTITGVKVKQ